MLKRRKTDTIRLATSEGILRYQSGVGCIVSGKTDIAPSSKTRHEDQKYVYRRLLDGVNYALLPRVPFSHAVCGEACVSNNYQIINHRP